MDDAASRFRDKYILKTTSYNVPERARRWYVRHVEVFIKAQSGCRLSTLTADDMERYLKEKGRSEKPADWQFRQMVDALRILFTGVVSPAWANNFDWAGWKEGAREPLPEQVLAGFADPDKIPEGNIRTMRKPGAKRIRAILAGRLEMKV